MKNQALFFSKDKSKKLKCRLVQFLFGALRVNVKINNNDTLLTVIANAVDRTIGLPVHLNRLAKTNLKVHNKSVYPNLHTISLPTSINCFLAFSCFSRASTCIRRSTTSCFFSSRSLK